MKNSISINQSHIITLCENSSNPNLYIKYIKILEPIKENTDSLFNFLLTENIDNQKFTLLIKQHIKEFKINNYFDYCNDISNSYQNINLKKRFIEQFLEKIDEKIETKNKFIKSKLLDFLSLKKEAITFNKSLEQVIKDSKNLMYSHRKIGWNLETYKINSKFNVKVNSNFGYGPVSYFYTLLNFDGINILPYSDFIEYRYSGLSEIINYSKKHLLTDESWLESFNYIIEATTIYNQSEKKFIEKYVLRECEKLVEGLEYFYSNCEFTFINKRLEKKRGKQSIKKVKIKEVYEERKLILFRSEKITGALKFINSINNYNIFFKVNSFINRIELLNKKVHPIMINEIKDIKLEIEKSLIKQSELENELENEKLKFLPANVLYNKVLLKYNITPSIREIKYLKKSEFYNFQKKYPNFGKAHKRYNELKQLVHTNNLIIHKLKNEEKQINSFIENYNKYFN